MGGSEALNRYRIGIVYFSRSSGKRTLTKGALIGRAVERGSCGESGGTPSLFRATNQSALCYSHFSSRHSD